MTEQTENKTSSCKIKTTFCERNRKNVILYTIIGALCAHSGFLNYQLKETKYWAAYHIAKQNNAIESLDEAVIGFFCLCNQNFAIAAEAYRKSSLGNQKCLNEIDDFVKGFNEAILESFVGYYGAKKASEAEKALAREKGIEFTFETYDNGRIKRKEAINKDKS